MKNADFIAQKKLNFGNFLNDLCAKYKLDQSCSQLIQQHIIKSTPSYFIFTVCKTLIAPGSSADAIIDSLKSQLNISVNLDSNDIEKIKKYIDLFTEVCNQ